MVPGWEVNVKKWVLEIHVSLIQEFHFLFLNIYSWLVISDILVFEVTIVSKDQGSNCESVLFAQLLVKQQTNHILILSLPLTIVKSRDGMVEHGGTYLCIERYPQFLMLSPCKTPFLGQHPKDAVRTQADPYVGKLTGSGRSGGKRWRLVSLERTNSSGLDLVKDLINQGFQLNN